MAEETAAISTLFEKHDAHGRRLSELEANQKLVDFRLAQNDKNFARYLDESRRSHAELLTTLKAHSADVKTVLEAHHRQTGIRDVLRWAIPVVISLIGVIAAVKGLT